MLLWIVALVCALGLEGVVLMDCVKCEITDLCRLRPYAVDVDRRIKEIDMIGLPFVIAAKCERYRDIVSKVELQKQLDACMADKKRD